MAWLWAAAIQSGFLSSGISHPESVFSSDLFARSLLQTVIAKLKRLDIALGISNRWSVSNGILALMPELEVYSGPAKLLDHLHCPMLRLAYICLDKEEDEETIQELVGEVEEVYFARVQE